MLVLSRKTDEKIIIGDDITICIVEIRGDKVRLGIEAPKHVTIHREEVYNAIKAEKARPSAGPLADDEDDEDDFDIGEDLTMEDRAP